MVGVLERAHFKGPCSDMQLSVCKECILMVEIILAKVEEINRKLFFFIDHQISITSVYKV